MQTVKQIASALGVGPDVIRHYTDIGLLRPAVGAQNGYRYYDPHDALRTADARVMRSLGFPLSRVKALSGAPCAAQLAALKDRERDVEEQLRELSLRLERLREVESFLAKSALCTGTVEDVARPPIHSLYTYGREKDYGAARRLAAAWMKHLPYTHISVKVPRGELNDPDFTGPYSVELGVGATDGFAKRLGLDLAPPVESIPGGRFLIEYLRTPDILSISPADLEPMLSRSRRLGRPFLNHSSGRLLAVEDGPQGPVYSILIRARIG